MPEPVGAMTSAFSPPRSPAQAPAWAAVGAAKTSRNQVAVAGENAASGSVGMSTSCPVALTKPRVAPDGIGPPSEGGATVISLIVARCACPGVENAVT